MVQRLPASPRDTDVAGRRADVAPQPYLADILRVERKVMPDGHAAAGAERQVLAHPGVLKHRLRRFVGGGGKGRRDAAIANGEATDLPRSREIPVQQRRRDRQHAADVVEPSERFVRRQQRRGVDVDVQEVPDGVPVFDAVQAVDDRPARAR